MRLSAQIDREIMRIYQQLKRDFPTYSRAVIIVAYNPLLQYRLNGVNQKVAHDVTVMQKQDLLPKDTVFVFASQVILKPDTDLTDDLQVVNLAWLQDKSVIMRTEHEVYTAKISVVVK